jgi:hypothetical protein
MALFYRAAAAGGMADGQAKHSPAAAILRTPRETFLIFPSVFLICGTS